MKTGVQLSVVSPMGPVVALPAPVLNAHGLEQVFENIMVGSVAGDVVKHPSYNTRTSQTHTYPQTYQQRVDSLLVCEGEREREREREREDGDTFDQRMSKCEKFPTKPLYQGY